MHKYFIFLVLNVSKVFGGNILFVSSVPSPSHHIWNRALAFGLANKEHNVTLLGPDSDKVKPANYTHIFTEGLYEIMHEDIDINALAELGSTEIIREFIDMCVVVCKSTLKSQGLQRLLDYPPDFKFDMVVMDVTLGSCLYPLLHKFNYPPAVGITAFLLPSYIGFNFGNHLYPAYVPWYGLPYNQDMTFYQRLLNFMFMYGEVILKNTLQYSQENEAARKVFGDNTPTMEELERHFSLVLTNTDPVLDRPMPLAPNFIAVGGLHTRKSKDIPKDLLSVLDGAKNGVIVFSLGSNVRSDKLDVKLQKELTNAFSKIKETVIWKFESDIENLPKNVVVRKWLPQNDLLGHSNVKLFIGHGGALSTQEAMFHGVPMICVPFFMDQLVNTRNVVDRKLGISLDFNKISTEYVLGKLKEVLDNPIYAKNMKEASSTFRDRAETPLERAIFWIEYVMRHGGAHFLNTPARSLPFYKASSLDIIGFLILIISVILFLIYKVVKVTVKLLSKSGTKVKKN